MAYLTVKFALTFLVLAIFIPQDAHAYIDPGSGSMVLQLLLAGVAGIGMACKLYWRRVVNIFRKSSADSDGESHSH